tara:strand:- start:230 stop:1135 length:906 start_codon:yes stop_codon:yes gene_type:complete
MINSLVQAILLGGYYALVACGLAFMFQVMRIINLAHGSLAILSAYLVWEITDALALSPFISVLMVLPIMAVVGLLMQRVILERATKGGELLPVLTTFGLAIVIDNLLFQQFGANTRSLAPYLGDLSWDSYEIFGLWIGKLPVIVLLTAIVVIGGLDLVLRFTPLGRQIRATAFDPETAGLVGIDARKIAGISAAIAMMTVAISGTALGLRGTFDAYAGGPQLLFAFEATIIGGTGSLWGVFMGGIILAIAQSVGALIHPQGFLLGGHLVFLMFLFARIYLTSNVFSLKHWLLKGHHKGGSL